MKIIKYLCLTIISLFVSTSVKALTNDGKIYEIFWQNSGVNVFASDETYNSLDYNGWMVVSNVDNYTYYCIEPEIYMQNSSDANKNTHIIYDGDNNIISNSRLNSKTLEKIKLLAYYGYGYKDSKVDHTSKKWYGITQVMIWRILRPDVNFVFKTSRYGTTNSSLYLKEVKELQNLVDNHYKSPSFNNTTITMKKGETTTIEDTNNVINNYIIKSKPYADFKIENNKLTITAKEEINENIKLEKQDVNNNFKLFKGKTLQDLVIRGKVTLPEFNFNLVIEGKDIIIKKVDADTKVFNDKLVGSVFGLYDSSNNLLKKITITQANEVINLTYGKFYLKELKAPEGYNLNPKKYEFEVNEQTNNLELVIENSLIKGDLEFLKVDYSTNKPLSGVLIEIYKEDNTLVFSGKTNEQGKIELHDLPYGKYYIKEQATIKYYRLNDEKIYFEIKENKKVVQKTMKNERKEGSLEFLKIDKDSKQVLKDALIEIYFVETKEKVFSGKTDENGKIFLDTLVAGKYYVIEKEAPYGYLLGKEKIYFEIEEDNEVVKVEMENEKIEVPNTYSKGNIFIYFLFASLVISLLLIKDRYVKNN